MKRLHVLSFCFHTTAWSFLALLSPALLAEPAGELANQLQDTLERQGWRIQKGADGSLIYSPPTTRTAVVPQPEPAAAEPGTADQPGAARVQPGPQNKPVSGVRAEAAPLTEEPGTADLTIAPGARSTRDTVGSAANRETPGQPPETSFLPPEPEQRIRSPRRSGYYRQPLHRPRAPAHYWSPPPGYRRAGPPCPYGPRDCRWRSAPSR